MSMTPDATRAAFEEWWDGRLPTEQPWGYALVREIAWTAWQAASPLAGGGTVASPAPEGDDAGGVEEAAAGIRAAWVAWARTQPNPKPSWLVPWESLDAQSKDADYALAHWHLAALRAAVAGEREATLNDVSAAIQGKHFQSQRDDTERDEALVRAGLREALRVVAAIRAREGGARG